MRTEPELLNERLERLAIVLDEIMPGCAALVRDANDMLKEQEVIMPRVTSVEQRCGNCNKVIEMDGWIACPWCGKHIDWKGWLNKNA